MSWRTIEKSCESTPFLHCNTPTGNIRLWWSKGAGQYGHQVHMFCTDANDYHKKSINAGKLFYKTAGCGFCKESQALEWAFIHLGYKPKGMSLGCGPIPNEYRKGGNYFAIPVSKWVKI
jgi:hypothetical protein